MAKGGMVESYCASGKEHDEGCEYYKGGEVGHTLDLKKFKKVGSTKTHTIMEHPDGHMIHIAHASLAPKHKKGLTKLAMAEGGKVPQKPAPQPAPQEDPKKTFEKGFRQAMGMADGGKVEEPVKDYGVDTTYPETLSPDPKDPLTAAGNMIAEAQNAQQPALEPAVAPTEQKPAADIFGKEAQSALDADVLKEEQAIQNKLSDVEAKKQSQVAGTAKKKEALNLSLEQQQQQILTDEAKELQAARDDMNNGHFHPKDIYSGKDTWGKVRTGIGLILGGLGSGMGTNPVLDMLNKQIERDAEAGGNLYKALEKKYGSKREALNMTKIYQTGALLDQLEVETAKAASQQAKLNGQQAIQQIQMSLNQKMQEHARNQAVNKMLSGNEGNPEKAGLLITQVVPENRQSEVRKELKEAQDMSKIKRNLLKSFDEVSNMTLAGAFAPHQRDAIIEPIVAQLSKESAGRYTEQDAKAIKHLFPSALDAPGTAKLKRQKLEEFVSQKMNFPSLAEFGIPVEGASAPTSDLGFKPKK